MRERPIPSHDEEPEPEGSPMKDLRNAVFEAYGPECEWPGCHEAGKELAHLTSRGMGGSKTRDTVSNVMVACWLHARITDGEGAGNHALFSRRIDPGLETLEMMVLVGYPGRLVYAGHRREKDLAGMAWHRAEALREHLERTRPFKIEVDDGHG